MKKILIFTIPLILLLCLFINSKSNDRFRRITFTGNETYFSGTLTNSGTNKYPTDTLLIDFIANTNNYLIADTFLTIIRIDTVVGLYGNRASDSLTLNKVQVKRYGAFVYPTSNLYGNYAIKDTITGKTASLTDSVLGAGEYKVYVTPIHFSQYYILIKHNFGDTASVNAQATTTYKGRITLK